MGNNKKILIVEDEGIVALEIKETLENLGYRVVGEAQTGAEAIEMSGDLSPDIVLMDIILQGEMDGIEAAERIYSFYGIPVIYLTSHSDEATLKRALKTNAFGYLIKPFNDRELYSNIEMTLHKHRIMKKVEPSGVVDSTLTFVSDAVVTTDSEGSITRINPSAESLTGWTPEEAVGRDIFNIFELDRDKISGMMESVKKDTSPGKSLLSWIDGLKIRTKSGEEILLSLNIGYVNGNKWDGDEYFFVLIPGEDETSGIKESRLDRYYRIVLDAINDSVFLADSDMKIVIYNQAFSDLCNVLGVSLNHLEEPVYDILPAELFGSKWDYQDIFRTGAAYKRERSYKSIGETRYLEIETIPLFDGKSVTHTAVIIFDVTWEKEMDERDEMIASNFSAHSENVEDIADLCASLKQPLGRIKKLAEKSDSKDCKKIEKEVAELSEIIFEMDMKWLKYEKIKSFFDIMGKSLREGKEDSEESDR